MYRNIEVKVGDKRHGGVYTPPKTLPDIKALMKLFCEWMTAPAMQEVGFILRAALAHYHLAKIHPFDGGNGRTARYLEAVILHENNVRYVPKSLSNYYHSHIDDYYIAFTETEKNKKNDVTAFLRFYLAGYLSSLEAIKDQVLFFIRVFTVKDFLKSSLKVRDISRRQHDLLAILLDTLKEFTLNDLFNDAVLRPLYRDVSEATARRDIKKLLEKGFILKTERETYAVNIHLLDDAGDAPV